MSVRAPPAELNTSAFPPVLHDWVIKGLTKSSRVCAIGHIKNPVSLIEKRRDENYECMFSPRIWPQMPTGRKTSTHTQKLGTPQGGAVYIMVCEVLSVPGSCKGATP